MIQVINASYRYPGNNQFALDNINLNIGNHDFVAIMGRNGSGKSTLARLLNGLLLPFNGSVIVEGLNSQSPQDSYQIKKKVGLVMSVPDNQIVAGTVEEDVAFGPENLGLSSAEIRARVDVALDLVGMSEYRHYPPELLSGGQKQRICIAGLLAMQPQYMVFDEPVAMLDPVEQLEIIKILRNLHQEQGLSIILITHSMVEAINANRIVVLKQGQIMGDFSSVEMATNCQQLLEWGIEPLEISMIIEHLNTLQKHKISTSIIELEELVEILCHSKSKI